MSDLNFSRKRHIGNGEMETSAQDAESTDSWEPARKKLRSLVRQFRALSLADLGWKRSRTPPLPLPDAELEPPAPVLRLPASPLLPRRLHPSPEPHHRVLLPAAELTITLTPSDELRSRLLETPELERRLHPSPEPQPRAMARRRGDSDGSRCRVRPIQTHFASDSAAAAAAASGRCEAAGAGGGGGGASGRASLAEYGGGDPLGARPLKRHELSECGSAAKKSRSRMRAGASSVVMTSCYIEQIVYP